MDCRTFRKHHVAYLDDTMPAVLLVESERHVRECEACAEHDTAVRRSLMLARNLPSVALSEDFERRLAARLDDVRCGRCEVPDDDVPFDWAPSRAELLRAALSGAVGNATTRRRVAAVAASLIALTYAGNQVLGDAPVHDVELPPVVATMPEPLPVSIPPALLTSATTGIPVWPAALLADQTPKSMVDAQLMIAAW